MGTVLVPLLAFVLVGGIATAWLFKVREPRERLSTGLMALSAMHWRELQRLVVAAMQERGYRPLATAQPAEDGLVPLQRNGGTWLLSTKHGTAYVLGTSAVGEFANAMQLRGAQGGLMATVGDVGADTRSLARTQRIEVLDGPTLWAEIAPLLETDQRTLILGGVHQRTRRHAAIAWGIAAAVAGLMFVLRPSAPTVQPRLASATTVAPAAPTPAAQPPRTAAAAPRPAPARATPPAPRTTPLRATPPAPVAAVETVPESPAALAERRRTLARSVGTLPWVVRAGWSTQSTLVIHLQPGATVDKAGLCKVVEAYPELRASRLQLQATGDSVQPVRFMQCRVY